MGKACVLQNIYARNCEIRKIPASLAKDFLSKYHRLAYTRARYSYGLFIVKKDKSQLPMGTLVAVATFSAVRKWEKSCGIIRSFEWLRYASLPDYRVLGAMSKCLLHFLKESRADDIMTYIDIGNYSGTSYKKLGFQEEGLKKFDTGETSLKMRLKLKDW